jgi:hypothetical protein
MGSALAKRLIEVGHEITVWNRNHDKTKPLAESGATVAVSPSELAGRVDTVITILTDATAITSVYEGKAGLLEGSVSGKLFIEMSTVQPETEIALAKKINAKGASLVECPVGGTVGPALTGKLLGLAGGTEADFARTNVPPCRSGRSDRCWRQHEARDQSAASGVLAGLWGSLFVGAPSQPRQRLVRRVDGRYLRRPECAPGSWVGGRKGLAK